MLNPEVNERRLRRRPGCWNQHGPNAVGLDHGSVLLLFPAAVMVMLVLAAIVIDIGLARVRVQELRAVASSAANDALGAVDTDALRNTGTISFDGDEAERLVTAAIASGPLPQATVDSVAFSRNAQGRWEIAVTVSMRIDLVIAPALPGGERSLATSVTERVLAISS